MYHTGRFRSARERVARNLRWHTGFRYNAACALTFREADLDGALDLLEPYFAGLDSPGNVHHAEIDPDMNALRAKPRFKSMIAAARERLGMEARA